MNFQANDLDAAYETITQLEHLAKTSGESLASNLNSLIGRLKTDWKGNDATVHINNLIDVYDGVRDIVQNVLIVAHNTSGAIVNVQTVRHSNGGIGNVGTVINWSWDGAAITIADTEPTTEFFADPTKTPHDLTTLTAEKGAFERFCSEFSRLKEELLSNWTSGSNHDKVVADFDKFETEAQQYRNYFSEAEENLSIAVQNLQKLN